MRTQPDRLARDFVDAALEIHRRRLWSELPTENLFLLRILANGSSLVVNVMGQAGEEFGLAMARGEGAFRRMSRMIMGLVGSEEIADEGDLLSLTFVPWNIVPEEFRRLLIAAGRRGRGRGLVPLAMVKRPYRHARPPGRDDLRSLLWVARGILAAHEADQLTCDSFDREQRRVLELELGGKIDEPGVTVRQVEWPESIESMDLPPLTALPQSLGQFPQIEESWLVAWIYWSTEVRGDDRTVSGVFVAEPTRGLILAHRLVMGNELAPVAEALVEAFRGQEHGSQSGLPREIVFDSPRLQRSFAPALAGLGIEGSLSEDHPQILALHEMLEKSAEWFFDSAESGPKA